jgi:hypothetical protein
MSIVGRVLEKGLDDFNRCGGCHGVHSKEVVSSFRESTDYSSSIYTRVRDSIILLSACECVIHASSCTEDSPTKATWWTPCVSFLCYERLVSDATG